MLKKTVNLLRGEVEVLAQCPFPERVLNLCAAREIAFWDLRWRSQTELSFRVARRDYARLRAAAEKLDGTLSPLRRQGAPFFLGKFRRRYALLAGLCACFAVLTASSFLIWDFEVSGNAAVPQEKILRALERNGITIGTFAYSIDGAALRNSVLLELPELSWLAVNVRGCRAYVQVVERIPAPELFDRRAPTNVVAAKSGVVTRVLALDGREQVLPGTTVLAGQLLISGAVDTVGPEAPSIPSRFLAGLGSVYARTWYKLSLKMPVTVEEKCYTGEEDRGFAVILGKKHLKIYGIDSSKTNAAYDKINNKTKLALSAYALPVGYVQETYAYYDAQARALSYDEAKTRGEAALTQYLSSLLDAEGRVISRHCTCARQGEWYVVTLLAECEEQIGRTVKILMD